LRGRKLTKRIAEESCHERGIFARLKDVQIAEPIWQPVIFTILVILISITLYFFQLMIICAYVRS
jgi:hypothetical protein